MFSLHGRSKVPRDPSLDGTLSMLLDGYEFIWKRCQAWHTDLFTMRVMGKRAVCIHGREAVALFYDDHKLQRHGAAPRRVLTTLFGKGAVHTLDGKAHLKRKAAFLSLMSPASLARLVDLTAQHWRMALTRWQSESSVVIFDEAQLVLTAATCAWAGVPLLPSEIALRARDFIAMVDAFGGVGPRLWNGKLARMRTERWLTRLVEQVRAGTLACREDSALYVMSHYRDVDGRVLSAGTAAVEVINVIRPTVAVSWYVTFAALALHQYPTAREKVAREVPDGGAGEYTDWFMHEVRRFYPFVPYLAAKVRAPFVWRGLRFDPGTLVLLDVYGENHDPESWEMPEVFWPERFERVPRDELSFIPQGGGDRGTGHRCPGEWITMHQVALALHFLARCITYEVVPGQDLDVDLRRIPARPSSGLVIRNVRATPALALAPPTMPSPSAAREDRVLLPTLLGNEPAAAPNVSITDISA